MPDVFIEPGRRDGRTLANEPQMIERMNAGDRVFTRLNGVWFAVRPNGDGVTYHALTEKPAGIE